jgi:hypothetical protein
MIERAYSPGHREMSAAFQALVEIRPPGPRLAVGLIRFDHRENLVGLHNGQNLFESGRPGEFRIRFAEPVVNAIQLISTWHRIKLSIVLPPDIAVSPLLMLLEPNLQALNPQSNDAVFNDSIFR